MLRCKGKLKEIEMSFEMKLEGKYAKIIIPNDGYDFLNGYEMGQLDEGTGLIFSRKQLEKYANLDYYDEDDKPNKSSLAVIQDVLNKHRDADLFILY